MHETSGADASLPQAPTSLPANNEMLGPMPKQPPQQPQQQQFLQPAPQEELEQPEHEVQPTQPVPPEQLDLLRQLSKPAQPEQHVQQEQLVHPGQPQAQQEGQEGQPRPNPIERSARRKRRAPKKTKICKFFLQGRCDNSECAYAHDMTDTQRGQDSTLRSTGNDQPRQGTHTRDDEQAQATSDCYKIKMCGFFKSGKCKHGQRCRFAHSAEEWRQAQNAQTEQQQQRQRAAQDAARNLITTPLPPAPLPSSAGYRKARGRRRQISNWAASYLGEQPPAQAAAGQQRELLSANNGGGSSSDQGKESEEVFPASDESGNPTNSGNSGTGSPASVPDDSSSDYLRGLTAGAEGATVEDGGKTTLLLRNVPTYLTQGACLSLLEDLTPCMRGNYDFFYCPWDQAVHHNLGFALINFTHPDIAHAFRLHWFNKELCKGDRGHKAIKVMTAAWQGLQANIECFSKVELARSTQERFRPLVRQQGGVLQPLRFTAKQASNNPASLPDAPEAPLGYSEQPPLECTNVQLCPMPLSLEEPQTPVGYWEQPLLQYPRMPSWQYY